VIHALALLLAIEAQRSEARHAADVALARRFCQALTSDEIRSFIPLAAREDDLAGDAWFAVRTLFWRYDCIAIASCDVRPERDGLAIELTGDGAALNARHERRPIARHWFLRLDEQRRIVSAKTEEDLLADALVAAADDDARSEIACGSPELVTEAAHKIADVAHRRDGARLRDAALFLLAWSQRTGDAVAETYALSALLRIARVARDEAAVQRLGGAVRETGRRAGGCDLPAYADLATFVYSDDLKGSKALLDPIIASADELDEGRLALLALHVRAGVAFLNGDLTDSFRTLDALHDLSRRYRSLEGELLADQDETLVLGGINDREGTVAAAKRTATLAYRMLDREYQARSSNMIGEEFISNRSDPDYAQAIPWLERALRIVPKTASAVAIYQINLGDALVRSGRAREAEKFLKPALAGGHAANFGAKAYLFAEHLRRAQGRYDEALAFAREGIADAGNSLFIAWELKADVGNMLAECGDVDGGIESLRESIDLIEARRVASTSDPLIRARYFATRQWVYASLLHLLIDRHHDEEAFAVAERMKARALDDLLAGSGGSAPLSPDQRKEEDRLERRIAELNRTLAAAKGNAAARARGALRLARMDLERFNTVSALRDRNRASQATVSFDIANAHGPPIVEYAVLPDAIVAFVVKNGTVTARRLETSRSAIEAEVRRFTELLKRRDLRYAGAARSLYDALFRPVAHRLENETRVIIVPDRFLWNVPFDALMTPARKFLVSRYVVSYAPSAAMLDAATRRAASRPAAPYDLLAMGDPSMAVDRLPDAAREVHALVDLYGRARSTGLTGPQASEQTFKKLAGKYRVVHLATHGFIDDESPLYSALVLARTAADDDDGLLEMREIRNLDLHADVAILSACDTAGGEIYPGEGVMGLSWAFLTAGCPTTVGSQWKASSRATSRLMIEFHRRLLAGDTKAEALTKAKRLLMHDRGYEHPFYWAPFVVIGDGNSRSFSPAARP